ncbi:MAG: ZIP family metal transporter, partial [Flavobacteriales bacterium]|nr:ZIP family metal transporter [Flavobacteriales bacterium]
MIYLSLFIVSLVSGCFIFIKSFDLKTKISSLLSFSGAYLLGICFLHLIPELFEENDSSVGLYLLIGFFLQLILDYFSGGIEHGHAHVNKKKIGRFPLLIFLSF